ncbi:MAG: NAD(P)/FAD-dependent oxidoreductase [Acidobacteria bacterium]|nr:NAD(P)/FAD-dependent oxidoreductase [Acidobacteriota bacterium]
MSRRIAIVGAGFLGLTVALRCAKRGDKVTVFELGPEIGGLAAAWDIGGIRWDKHYHVTLLSDSYTRAIVEEIGLGDEFRWVETRTGFYSGGKLYSMSNTMEFLRFPPLDLISKLRLGGTIFYASKVKNWRKLEKISVEEWLTRLSGRKTFQRMWRPLLRAKLGDSYKETSAAFIWATIQRMYAARRSGLKREMFGYVRGGYARVLGRFGERLAELGVEIKLNTRAKSIHSEGGKVKVEAEGHSDDFDAALLTCTPRAAAGMLPELTQEEKARYEAIPYQGIICASLILKRPLSEFYVTNITDETPFTGIIEMTALVEKSEFDGNSLVYLPKYLSPNDEMFTETDETIKERFLAGLEAMYPELSRSDVAEMRISRVKEVFPIPVVGYSELVAPVRTSIKGVYVLNSSHIANGTLNVNETVQLAEAFFCDHL